MADKEGNVWLSGMGRGDTHPQILELTESYSGILVIADPAR